MSPELYQQENESFNTSGVSNRGQGADFNHEEINKLVKSFLPPEIPTQETWRRVQRKATDLKDLKNDALSKTSINERSYQKRKTVATREVQKKLRHPIGPLTSFGNYQLDEPLVNVKQIAVENYKNYKNCYAQSGIFGCRVLHPIFITLEEKAQSEIIENKAKAEIIIEIKALFNKIPKKDEVQEIHDAFCKKQKQMKHQELTDTFYIFQRQLLD